MRDAVLERRAELRALARAARSTRGGAGRFVLIEGPAGIGKSLLLASAREIAAEAGLEVLSARGTELARESAFGVVRQLFGHYLADQSAPRSLWSGTAAQARGALADDAPLAAGNFAVLHGLHWLTVNACEIGPLALVVDDLQWCDAPSLRYLTYVLQRREDLRLLVVGGVRVGEEGVMDQLLAGVADEVLRPGPLSLRAARTLLGLEFVERQSADFGAECHAMTGGNPLFLREVVRTLGAHASTPNTVRREWESGGIARMVADRMRTLPPETVALAQAFAVLGDGAPVDLAALLAGQRPADAESQAARLSRLEIVRVEHGSEGAIASFVHPLVQAAVYGAIPAAAVSAIHREAAQLLGVADAGLDRIAAHLLRVPPAGDPYTVATLREAAAQAANRGSPGSGYVYLRRCLAEPPDAGEAVPVLIQAGQTALQVDLPTAIVHLQEALDRLEDPVARAKVALDLGTAYLYHLDPTSGVAVWSEALDRLGDGPEDLRRRLMAARLDAAWVTPQPDMARQLAQAEELPPHDSVGGRLLDCAVSCMQAAYGSDPAALPLARHAVEDGSLVEQANGNGAMLCGWVTLLAGDDDLVMDTIDSSVRQAYRAGSIQALTPALAFRSLGWLWRGRLAEAEHDARESMRLAELAHLDINQLFADPYLADVLIEQGRLDEAAEILTRLRISGETFAPGPAHFALDANTRLLRGRGDNEAAVAAAWRAAAAWEAYRFVNPALGAWRTEAALALHALGRVDQARAIAAEELELARRWRAPRTLGRALRTSSAVTGGDEGLTMLHGAVAVLRPSPARLEYAKALADLGVALSDRDRLAEALDISLQCGAKPLTDQVIAALGASPGAPQALTPHEKRVAHMAAQGWSDREIAQVLFVTPGTVEAHLGSVYRKLNITERADLVRTFPTLT